MIDTSIFFWWYINLLLAGSYYTSGVIGEVVADDKDASSPNNAITYSLSTMQFGITANGTLYNKVLENGATPCLCFCLHWHNYFNILFKFIKHLMTQFSFFWRRATLLRIGTPTYTCTLHNQTNNLLVLVEYQDIFLLVKNLNLFTIKSFKVDLSKQETGSKIIFNVTAANSGDLPLTGSAVVEITILSKTESNATEIILYTPELTSTTSTEETSTSTSAITSPITTSLEKITNLPTPQKDQYSGEVHVFVIVGSVLLSLAVIMICASIIIWRCVERKPVINGRYCLISLPIKWVEDIE